MELCLPSRHHHVSPVSDDRYIMEMDISSKQLNRDQSCIINISRIKLQVVFISEMLEHGTNRIKENYQQGEKDRFTISSFHWPHVTCNKKATKVWKIFIAHISNSEGNLLSPLNTSIHKLAHVKYIVKISQDNSYLKLNASEGTSFFELEHIRSKLRIERQVPPIETTLNQCQCAARQTNLIISKNKRTMHCEVEHNVASDQWYETILKGVNLENFYEFLIKGDATVSVDGSFSPIRVSWHHLIASSHMKKGS